MSENTETTLRLGLLEDRVKYLESIVLSGRRGLILPEVRYKYDKLQAMVAAEFKISPEAMQGIAKAMPIPTARGVLWMLCQDVLSFSAAKLADLSCVSYNSVGYTVRMVRHQIHSNSDLAAKIESIKQEYNKTT